MKNHELIIADEEMMKAASDTFFRQFIEWSNSSDIDGIGWIPVTERLPGTERILITNGEFVKEGYRRPDGVWKYGRKEDELFSNLSSKGVIAWMPLPKPYNPLN